MAHTTAGGAVPGSLLPGRTVGPDMDGDRVAELLVHYLAMFFAVWLVLGFVWRTRGRLALWLEFLVLVAVCVAYMIAVRQLGIAPRSWQP